MKISVVSFTRAGAEKNLELTGLLQSKNHQAASYSWHTYTGRRLIPFQSAELLFADLWKGQELIILLGRMDQVIQKIAPLIGGSGIMGYVSAFIGAIILLAIVNLFRRGRVR